MERERERLVYLFGEEALDQLDAYDLDVESDVIEVVERFLPVGASSAASGAAAAVLTIAVTQILNDSPPETWQAVTRMREAGLDRDQVLDQLTRVIREVVVGALASNERLEAADMVAALDALPLPSSEQIAEALLAVARANPGILVEEHVTRTIAALGPPDGTPILEPLVERAFDVLVEGPLHLLPGDVSIVFHDAIAGRTFTHRLTDAERELGSLVVSVDLAGFGRFDTVRLADGTELELVPLEWDHLEWHGPDGWLDAFSVGDLLAVTASFDPPVGDEPIDATISIGVLVDEPAMTDELVATMRAAYDSEHDQHGLPANAQDLVVWLCHHDPDLFTSPLPPLTDVFAAAGLELNGSSVADDPSVWRREALHQRFMRVMDLVPDPIVQRVLARTVDVLTDPESSTDDVRTCLGECAEAETLDILAEVLIPELLRPEDELVRDGVEAPGLVFELVERAIALARRPREVATAEYLACVLRERCGQPLLAADHIARAAEAQPRLDPVVERMGWYCFDRGDARGAMRWWGELDEVHPAASIIARFLSPTGGATKIGRNDPCWCGSGRKFKQCHQTVSTIPALPDRVGWLCRKASLWLEHTTGDIRQLATDLAIAWVTGDPDADISDLIEEDVTEMRAQFTGAFADPIVFDAALHEGGLFSVFLRERGQLLPADEHLLAQAWQAVDRSVHEVLSVERGVGMTLRDLASGEVADVRERSLSRAAQVGERYCARVVPDGESNQIIGGVFEVRTGQERAVLDLCADADPLELCAWAGALAHPPRLVHQPG